MAAVAHSQAYHDAVANQGLENSVKLNLAAGRVETQESVPLYVNDDIFGSDSEDAASEAESQVVADGDVGEEVEESGDDIESEDGGFDLASAGKKPAPAGKEGEDESEEDSDAEEAEIWKVRWPPLSLSVVLPMALIGDESYDAFGSPG